MSASNSSARNFVPMANKYERVVLLVDMDCFYCQVEEKLDPSLKNQPLAVVQYNAWKGGGIIAVNYAARDKGVTRHMRGDEAKEQCPEIKLVKVPNVREKADLTKYREAGKEVANVLQRFTPLLERASVDEAYLDITDVVNKRFQEMNNGTFILQPQELVNTYAVGFQTIGEFVTTITTSFITSPLADDDKFYRNFNENDVPAVRQSNIRLLIGASIASEIRSAVKAETSYECSAGIAHNKILAKLACGINKPNKQTILPLAQTPTYFETLPIGKIKGLGAKFGEEVCERLSVRYLGQLLKFTETELQRKFDEKNGTWLYNICRGIDLEAVTPRFYSKSIGCCKKFPGRNNITGIKTLQHWLNELANEINERLEKDICENNRRAKQMVVNFIQEFDGEEISSSRSAPLQSYDTVILANNCLEIIKANTKQFFHFGSESVLNNPIKFLGLTVGKFETISNSQNNIQEMFAQQAAKKQKVQNDCKDEKASPSMSSTSGTNMVPVLDTEPGYFPTQMAKEKNTQNIKSFFLNAFKKDQNRDDVKPKTNLEQLDPTKLAYKKAFTPNELQISRSDICSDSVKQTAQKSFFARALKINEKTKEVAASDFTSKQLDTTRNCNEKQTLGTNNGICNELNGLIDDINTIQNKENENNFEPMNENKNSPSSNNVFTIALSTANSSNIELSNNEPESKNISISMKRNYDKMSDTDELNGLDYRFRYAEFAVPEFRPEFLQFTNCSKCGTKIVNNPASLQTHQDHHYAQELSQQQRHEFREKIRTKIMSSKSPPINASNKKSKKSQLLNNSVKKTNADITKFLTSSSTTIPSVLNCEKNQVPESNISTLEICNICKLPFKIVEMSEHKDFHVAKDLHRKLNQLEVQTVEVVQKLSSDLSRKTMNSSLPSPSRKSKVNAKPITHFLTKSNM